MTERKPDKDGFTRTPWGTIKDESGGWKKVNEKLEKVLDKYR